jgi:hypothetical protein
MQHHRKHACNGQQPRLVGLWQGALHPRPK